MITIPHFRKLGFDDIDRFGQFLELNNRSEVTTFFHPFPMLKETSQKILKTIKKDLFFVAILDNEFIGLSMLRGFDEGFEIPSFGMFIDAYHQGKGYGRKLIEWTLNQARECQIKKIRLAVYPDNKIALQLYQSLGFIKTEDYLDEHGRIRFIMHKCLMNI